MTTITKYVLGSIAAAWLVIVSILVLMQVSPHKNTTVVAFVPDEKNDKEIFVRGWNTQELRAILGDFSRLYQVPLGVAVQPVSANTWRLTFPRDCEPRLFLFLINYLNYPKNFDLTNRTIGVLGVTTFSPNFQIPASVSGGTQATVYVPAGDRDYDVVYAHLRSGETYEMSFVGATWRRVEESRIPSTTQDLFAVLKP